MRAYCENCTSLQPSSFRPGNDAATGEPYEDLCCDTCHFIVATVQEREALAQPAQEPVAYVTGTSFGRFIVEPLNPAMVLPVGMALYSSPQGNT
jgi:hypothetical protein